MGGARFGSRWLGQVRRVAVVVSVILVGAADWLACSPIAAGFPTTIAGDGMYVVGRDIQPGTYATAGGRSCFWERLSGLSGEFDDVIANDFVEGQGYVTIAPTDVAFSTRRCPPWTLVSAPAAAVPALPRVTAAPVPAGALNVTTPIGRPACDGSGIVVFGSVTTPGEYDAGVQQLLNANPGASYLRTDQSCPSLRQATAEGNPIYAVYRLAGKSQDQVCAAVNAAGRGAYGKWLDYTTDPAYVIPC